MKRYVTVLIGSLLLMGCRSQPVVTNARLSVAASFYPLAYLAEKIGGDLVDVMQITPGGVEPHDYEPTPLKLAHIYDAKVFIMNGGGIDAWAEQVRQDLVSKGKITVKMTEHFQSLITSNQDERGVDPHLWIDPVNMEREAEVVLEAFIEADPAHAITYRANGVQLKKNLTALGQRYRSGLQHCTLKEVIVSHDAFRHLAKEYGFSTMAISGLSPEEEPSPKRVAELAMLAKQKHIDVIFFESLVSPKLADTLAQEVGAQSLVLNPIEGLTPKEEMAQEDYITIMDENLRTLRTAMHCS